MLGRADARYSRCGAATRPRLSILFPSFATLAASFSCPLAALRSGARRSKRRELSLLLLRHAEAERGGGVPDEDRPLTKEGRRDAERLGGLLGRDGRVPDVIISSPARRAAETATLVAGSMGFGGTVDTEPALYGGGVAAIGAVVKSLSSDVSCVLVVAHDPAISACVERLTGVRARLPAGALAELAIEPAARSRIDAPDFRAKLVRLWRPRRGAADMVDRAPRDDVRKRSKWFAAAADERVSVAAARAVEEKLDDVLERLVQVADAAEEDGEAVRRLRVAARRAEAALRAFREVLPQRAAMRVREALRSVRSATNAARDADVLLARLAPIVPEELGAVLRADRRAAQHEVRALCRRLSGDAGFARRVASLTRKARSGRGDGDAAAMPFGAWAQARLTVSARRFFGGDVPDLTDVEQLHDLRLRTKKLRYEIEILAAVSPPGVRTDAYPILTGLQDRLGDVNDCAVAVRRLEELACATSLSRGTPAFDVLVREANDLLSRSRADLSAWWTPLRAEQLKTALA